MKYLALPLLSAGLIGASLAGAAWAGLSAQRVASEAPVAPSPALTLPPLSIDEDDLTLDVALDRGSVMVGGDGLVRAELVISSHHVLEQVPRTPTDLTVVLDTSGSMEGDKMDEAQRALGALVDALDEGDRFSLITYSHSSDTEIPMSPATASAKSRWHREIRGLRARGSTDMSAGLDRALDTSRAPGRAGRMILISDGLPNQGDSSHSGLVARARSAAVSEIPLTAVGVGDNFNEHLMTAIADAGTGNYYYLHGDEDLSAAFAGEFDTARATVASGLTVTFEGAPGAALVDAAGYPLEQVGDDLSFRVGSLYAGQTRRIWVTLQVEADAEGAYGLGALRLDYSAPDASAGRRVAQLDAVEAVADEGAFMASIDADRWSRGVLDEEYNALREQVSRSIHSGEKGAALQAITDYRERNTALNTSLGSDDVWENLRSLSALESEVDEAFSGSAREQLRKRNLSSKGISASAFTTRRGQSAPSLARDD